MLDYFSELREMDLKFLVKLKRLIRLGFQVYMLMVLKDLLLNSIKIALMHLHWKKMNGLMLSYKVIFMELKDSTFSQLVEKSDPKIQRLKYGNVFNLDE